LSYESQNGFIFYGNSLTGHARGQHLAKCISNPTRSIFVDFFVQQIETSRVWAHGERVEGTAGHSCCEA